MQILAASALRISRAVVKLMARFIEQHGPPAEVGARGPGVVARKTHARQMAWCCRQNGRACAATPATPAPYTDFGLLTADPLTGSWTAHRLGRDQVRRLPCDR